MAFKKKSHASASNEELSASPNNRRWTRDLAGLSDALNSDDASDRRWAAKDLKDFPDSVAALSARLSIEKERAVSEAIIATLSDIGTHEAAKALAQCLRSEDVYVRNEAIEALKLMPEVVSDMMIALITDESSDIRIFAVNILESLRHKDVEAWLIKVIEKDAHINVCATAVDLLAELGTEKSIQPLTQLKARFPNEPYIGFTVDLAMKRLRAND